MKHGSLFSGIGGFDLAAEWMGWENIFHCEWNPFGQKVLKHYWPNAITYHDITKSDFTIHRGQIDILTGGFPCQPYSSAGKRKGTEDARHLWPEMLRAIREIQPRYVVGENVRGLTNWNGGLVFDQVQADLENEGFEVLPFLLPIASVHLDQIRERVWFVAHNTGYEYFGPVEKSNRRKCWRKDSRKPSETWLRVATSLCRVDVRLSERLDGITVSKWNKESIKSYGNSVSPKIVYQIFKAIQQTEDETKKEN